VLRKTFGLESEKVTAGWRKLPTMELSEVYSSPDIVRVITEKRIS
jgi:hypothetical protein